MSYNTKLEGSTDDGASNIGENEHLVVHRVNPSNNLLKPVPESNELKESMIEANEM